jgi:hypothetical protein
VSSTEAAVNVVPVKTGFRLLVGAVLTLAAASTTAAGTDENKRTQIRAFKPEADTYVTAAAPERNFGSARLLRADSSPRATIFLRFRIRKLEGDITSVTLLLHGRAGARSSYQVRPVHGRWREQQLTYENAPELSRRYASSKPVRLAAWSAIDVTPFVVDDEARVSLAITTRSSTGVAFASRESERGPRLVVRTSVKEEKDEGAAAS